MARTSSALMTWTQSSLACCVAASGDCFRIQGKETWRPKTRVPGRRFKPIRPPELPEVTVPTSWFIGIILCPGDSLDEIVAWFAGLSMTDRNRIKFYRHPMFDPALADGAFHAKGVDAARAVTFAGSWEAFHSLFGLDHARQVLEDHATGIYSRTRRKVDTS